MNQIISQWRQQVTTRHQLREKKAHKRGDPNLPKRKALKFSLMLLQQDSMRWKCFGAVFFSYTQLFRVLARQDSFSLCRVQLVHLVPVDPFALIFDRCKYFERQESGVNQLFYTSHKQQILKRNFVKSGFYTVLRNTKMVAQQFKIEIFLG